MRKIDANVEKAVRQIMPDWNNESRGNLRTFLSQGLFPDKGGFKLLNKSSFPVLCFIVNT